MALLGRLWRRREERQPVLVVIDEAHNVCPAEPVGELQALATEHVIRIAGEGRKFGIYLLLSTQRPQKLHPNVLSQCDNLILMRMNSVEDVGHLASTFSFVPPRLLEQSTNFTLGEALLAGKIAPTPTLAKFEGRLSPEGGGDVEATWAGGRTRTVLRSLGVKPATLRVSRLPHPDLASLGHPAPTGGELPSSHFRSTNRGWRSGEGIEPLELTGPTRQVVPMPNQPRRSYSRSRSRRLRREMTEEEVLLWWYLNGDRIEAKFRRQVPIGPYIVDFACHAHKLVIEIDGSHHADSSYDEERDRWLRYRGWRVMRFWNREVKLEMDRVLDNIVAAIEQ